MTDNAEQIESTVTARLVPMDDRLKALPRHFARLMGHVETMVYAYLDELAQDYKGAYWEFFDLSNGGFYMAPEGEGELRLVVAGNYFDGSMSKDAAGIVACLFAYGYLANSTGSEAMTDHYHALREYALEHPEAGQILAAID